MRLIHCLSRALAQLRAFAMSGAVTICDQVIKSLVSSSHGIGGFGAIKSSSHGFGGFGAGPCLQTLVPSTAV